MSKYSFDEKVAALEEHVERMQRHVDYLSEYIELVYLTESEEELRKEVLQILNKKIKKLKKAKTMKKVKKVIDVEKLTEEKFSKRGTLL